MSSSAFPTVPQGSYRGWDQVPAQQDDRELTRTGRGTPAGEYMRRFWQPVALVEEVKDLPIPLKILGEELVLFRDGSGKIGLLHRHCSHRGASLEFGIISERGIRCSYHGFQYDVDGSILDTPALPKDSRIKKSLCHGAYPTIEYAGLIFAYFGPPKDMPPFPVLDAFVAPADNEMRAYKLHFPCNWLQVHENGADPMHVPFVHALMSEVQFTKMFGAIPVVDNVETPLGFLSLATRRWGDNLYIRANDVILPNMAQFGTPFVRGEEEKFAVCAGITRWVVPIDDENNWTFGIRHFNSAIDPFNEGRRDLIGSLKTDGFGQTGDRPYLERQRNPGDWDVQMSQGPIAIHANEHLAAHDSGVTLLRRLLRSGIRDHANGKAPPMPAIYPQDNIVPTYVAEIVFAIPPQGMDEDTALQRFGRAVAEMLVETQDLPYEERSKEIERRVRSISTEALYA
jgi:nitrite reductase/ring-hydroxylating ferredoxin subunit